MSSNSHVPWKAVAAILLSLGVTGCQQLNGMLGKPTPKNPPPYYSPSANGMEWSGQVKKEQAADVQMAVAQSLESQGQIDQAMKIYRDVIAKDGRRADAYHRLAVLHDKKGETQTSRKLYETALKKDPKNAEIHCDFGYSCYLQQQWGEAEKQLRQAIALNAELARAHNNLGLLLAHTGRKPQALKEFSKAGCTEADAHANLAFALMREQRWQEAEEHYRIALAADPSSPTATRGLQVLQALQTASDSGEETAQSPGKASPSPANVRSARNRTAPPS